MGIGQDGPQAGQGQTLGGGATSLRAQLEKARFDRALAVAESLALHRALLTTAELARMNNICCGRKPEDDPWRRGGLTLQLPSGKTETLSVLADPVLNVREKLHQATEKAEAGAIIEAAVDLYVGLVRLHPFEDANRRSAVLSAHYFLQRYGVPVSGTALHEIGLGDIRDGEQVELLRETVRQMAKFAQKRKG
jgi:prophage maintenance system killer protein